MIQDIAPHRFHVEYTPAAPRSNDRVLLFYKGLFYLRQDHAFFTVQEITAQMPAEDPEELLYFLFHVDTTAYYLVRKPEVFFPDSDKPCSIPEALGIRLSDIRYLSEDVSLSFIAYTAAHLSIWYDSNHYCGHCGSPMLDGTDERKRVCPSCGREVFPRINPAVIVAVHDQDRLLMTKYAGRSVTWFVLVAGFCEIGESAEETVRREVLEETGIHVKNIRYFGSQPWGIPGNLTLGYTAELDGSDEITLDRSELAEGAWIERAEVPQPKDNLSITSAMIQAFREGRF